MDLMGQRHHRLDLNIPTGFLQAEGQRRPTASLGQSPTRLTWEVSPSFQSAHPVMMWVRGLSLSPMAAQVLMRRLLALASLAVMLLLHGPPAA